MNFSLGLGTGGIHFSGSTRGTAPPPSMTREELNSRFGPILGRKAIILGESMDKVRSLQEIERRPTYTTTPIRREQVKHGIVYTRSQEYESPVVQTKQRVQTTLARLTGERERVEREHQFWDGLKTSMTRSGIPSSDIQTIFTDRDVTAVLHNLRNYNQTFTSVASVYTGALQRLARDSESDRPWWSRDFTTESAAVTFIRSQATIPLEDRNIFSRSQLISAVADIPKTTTVRNPRTGETVEISERIVPKFRPGQKLKDSVMKK